jgi:ankyrin repeat protein
MLQVAIYRGRNAVVQLLTAKIDFGIQKDEFENALQLGCIHGHMTIVEHFIGLGINMEREDEHGWSPLLCASWFQQGQILDYLLSNGGDRHLLSYVNTIPPNSWSRIDKSTKLLLDENLISVRYGGKSK